MCLLAQYLERRKPLFDGLRQPVIEIAGRGVQGGFCDGFFHEEIIAGGDLRGLLDLMEKSECARSIFRATLRPFLAWKARRMAICMVERR